MVVVNKDTWEKINEDDRKIILDCMNELSEKIKDANDKDHNSYIETLRSKGMEINDNVDKEAFRKAMLPVYEEWSATFGDELMKIYNEASGW